MSTVPETIETSTSSLYKGMMPASADLSHLWLAVTVLEHIGCRVLVRGQKHNLVWHLDKLWFRCRGLVTTTKFSVGSAPPRIKLIISG